MDKDVRAFLKTQRKTLSYRPVCERIKDYREVVAPPSAGHTREQASRCMNCGTPFCHWGCPVGNYIPEWNDLVNPGQLKKAFDLLDATNNLPEITGRVCPAPCEYACVLGINDDPVTIRENELSIIESAFSKGYVAPRIPLTRTGKKIAVIGSGPAGLSCAAQLNKAGHTVTVYEKAEKAGGILRYGIPDFKLEKYVIDRRLSLLEKEGIRFVTSCDVGKDYAAGKLLEEYDAVCLAGGSRTPRDLPIEGRELSGIHFAMDYLTQSNKRVAGETVATEDLIDAGGKKVVVIGGGDTGSDCVGTANRQGAACVVQIEVMSTPPECRTNEHPWPSYPMLLKTSSSHEEGVERMWSVLTRRFIGRGGCVEKIECARVEFVTDEKNACPVMQEIPGSTFEIEADLIILAIGFVHPAHPGLLTELGVAFDRRGNVQTGDDYMSSVKGVFCAGDMRRGQSLVVWAVAEGRRAAHHIDNYLMGEGILPEM
ncbi:MAG: glutamate synthase subunit beta [Candidatus Omnitrophica bacterium]|nr:glutamate synthase subunit beta [Candidatus Omnitrophota bacterium]